MEAKYLYKVYSPNLTISNDKLIKEEVSRILPILPPDTKFIKYVVLPVSDLCLNFEVFFKHPWFEEGMTIETEYTRKVYADKTTQTLKQFNLFRSIKYIKEKK